MGDHVHDFLTVGIVGEHSAAQGDSLHGITAFQLLKKVYHKNGKLHPTVGSGQVYSKEILLYREDRFAKKLLQSRIYRSSNC